MDYVEQYEYMVHDGRVHNQPTHVVSMLCYMH